MTIEKAIRILEPGTQIPNIPHTSEDVDEACRIAVAALRAQQPRPLDRSQRERCEMCGVRWTKKDWGDGGGHDFRINGDTIYYFYAKFGWEGIRIKYCPFCGCPLTEEAWAELERRIGGNDGTAD